MDSQTRPQQTHRSEEIKTESSREEAERLRLQVARLCAQISRGKVISYGALGAKCEPPISGYICGRVMGTIMDGVPWWRVVAKDGKLPISKRSPTQSAKQRELLEGEGVEFSDDGRVEAQFFESDSKHGELF